MLEWAESSSEPIARRTYEGSSDSLVHALPDDNATFFSAINKLSPSTQENERFKQPKKVYVKYLNN